MDILGPFLMATGQRRFVIVAIDYFTKGTQAKALATITTSKCEEFFRKNVVCRFGVPKILITDNGKQFDNSNFRSFCEEALLPLEVSLPTVQVLQFAEAENEENLRGNLDLLDDVRAQALDRMISTKRVRMKIFRVGDLVLRKLEVFDPKAAVEKLSPNWEGPYKVSKVLRPGAYSLETLFGEAIPRTWNAENLRQYYQ
ncbi:hypothetical protein RJ639_020383 [Escallonia herrerae]|uniref:Integrase catalytic domain-containing protein n=1 Tax=Escallonia herrerae TaxID=1293975 RepID=A0AA88V707_9ASTE|nr:hypothetical protein RJ639_020383 [Escallonia herrerae]